MPISPHLISIGPAISPAILFESLPSQTNSPPNGFPELHPIPSNLLHTRNWLSAFKFEAATDRRGGLGCNQRAPNYVMLSKSHANTKR